MTSERLGLREKFAEAHAARRRITAVEVNAALLQIDSPEEEHLQEDCAASRNAFR